MRVSIWFFFALAVLTGEWISSVTMAQTIRKHIRRQFYHCGFDIVSYNIAFAAKQASLVSAAPSYEQQQESVGENVEKRSGDTETGGGGEASDGDVEEEEPLPDKEDGEDLTDFSGEVQKRDLADLLSNLDEKDIEDSEVIDMADGEDEEVRAVVKRSNPVVSTKLVLGIAQNKLPSWYSQ